MCGIYAIIDSTGRADPSNLASMLVNSRYRGPDAKGTSEHWVGPARILLGVNRLRIRDVTSRADQPFISTCGQYLLLYNGEIYNEGELRSKLSSHGQQFNSGSDTEVVLYWLIKKGQAGLADLQGMFAFIFIDLTRNKLIVARDRSGIKPLFYHHRNGLNIFASQPDDIIASGLVEKKINDQAVKDYLRLKYACPPATFYSGVMELAPGNILSLNLTDQQVETTTIKLEQATSSSSLNEALSLAVGAMINPDKKAGIMLSGGIDSSLLLAVGHEEFGMKGIQTYTLLSDQDDSKFSEANLSRKIAKRYEAEHHELIVGPPVLERLEEYAIGLDQPVADGGGFTTWLLCEFASSNVNTLLSGAGADEYFAGYNRHWAYYVFLKWMRNPQLQFLLKSLGMLPSIRRFRLVNKYLSSLDPDPYKAFNNFLKLDIRPNNLAIKTYDKFINSIDEWFSWALKHDQINYLVSDVLAITDRASMRHSVEVRLPYLFDPVLDYAKDICSIDMIRQGRKHLLKEALLHFGGNDIIHAPKRGFGLPLSNWLRLKKSKYLWNFMNSNALIFNFVEKTIVKQLLDLHCNKRIDRSQEILAILILQFWLDKHFM